MKSSALFFTAVDRVEVVETNVPAPGPGEVLIETLFSGISPGTELRCLAGRQPALAFPFVPGYSLAGRLAEAGPGVSLPVGALVFASGTEKLDRPRAWGGHVAHAVCHAGGVHVLPPNVDPAVASLVQLAAIAHHGLRVSAPRPHEHVVVLGLGAIGQLAARLHRLAGARVIAVDLSPERLALARAAGLETVLATGDLRAALEPLLPHGADVVVDATGANAVLPQAVAIAKGKPWDDSLTEPTRLVIQGSYPGDFSVPYQAAFEKELSILLPRHNQPRDVRAVLGYLADGRLRYDDLISVRTAPGEAARVYADLRAGKPGVVTGVVQWR